MATGRARHDPVLIPGYLRPWAVRIAALLEAAPGDIALDLMCDSGVTADALAARGAEVTGLDSDRAAVVAAATQVRRGVTLWHHAGPTVPFPDGGVTVVASLFTLGFAPAPAELVGDVRRVLAPGGRVAMAVWSARRSAERLLRDTLAADGLHSPFLDTLLEPALGDLSWLSEEVVRDVARFDGIEHFWLGMVQRRPVIDDLMDFDDSQRAEIRAHCAAALAPHTAADGTMRVPVEARLLVATRH